MENNAFGSIGIDLDTKGTSNYWLLGEIGDFEFGVDVACLGRLPSPAKAESLDPAIWELQAGQ